MSPISTLSSKSIVVHRVINSSKRFQQLEWHLTVCKEKLEHVLPKNVYQLHKTLFDESNSFHILYCDDQKLFKNTTKFDFESIRVQEDKFNDTDTTTRIVKHVLISVSISSNLDKQRIFSSNSNSRALVESSVDALDGLAIQNKAQIKLKFLEIENRVKTNFNQFFLRS